MRREQQIARALEYIGKPPSGIPEDDEMVQIAQRWAETLSEQVPTPGMNEVTRSQLNWMLLFMEGEPDPQKEMDTRTKFYDALREWDRVNRHRFRTCENCGGFFMPQRSNARFCSRPCIDQAKAKRMREEKSLHLTTCI